MYECPLRSIRYRVSPDLLTLYYNNDPKHNVVPLPSMTRTYLNLYLN